MEGKTKKPMHRGHNEGNIRQRTDGRWEVRPCRRHARESAREPGDLGGRSNGRVRVGLNFTSST